MSANNDSISKTLIVTITLCVVCAIFVSAAAVGLRPLQQANKERDLKSNVLAAAGIETGGKTIEEVFDSRIKARVLNLETLSWDKDADPSDYNTYARRKLIKDADTSVDVPADEDIATIKRRAKKVTVYTVGQGDDIETLILPVRGYGLWSTLYGFLALESDLNTVAGLTFYEHAETPGLGGEVDNPRWKALWPGKEVYAEDPMDPALRLVKGRVGANTRNAEHKVDGLAGATLTSNGVSYLIQYWMSDNVYAPFLKKLRNGEV